MNENDETEDSGARRRALLRRIATPCAAAVVAFVLIFGCVTKTNDLIGSADEQAQARRDVGMDHLANGRTAFAIRDLGRALELAPDDAMTHLWLGEAYRRKGLLEKAEQYALQSFDLDPGLHATWLALSILYVQMGRHDESIYWSQKLIDDPTFPTPFQALTNLGWAQLEKGDPIAARKSFEDALEFRRNYWPALLNLGIIANMGGSRLEAIEYFQQVLDGNLGYNANAEANFRMAEVYVTLGRKDKAVEHFEVAAESAPNARWGKQSQEYLELLRR